MKNKIFIIFISFLVIFTGLVAIGPVSHATGLYKVTFIGDRLPPGTNWSVSINNTVHYSLNNSISVLLPNGVYQYTVLGGVLGTTPYPSTGYIKVNGANVNQTIEFFSNPSKIIGNITTMSGYQITYYNPGDGYIYNGIYTESLIYVIDPNKNEVIKTISLYGPLSNYVIVNNYIYALSTSAKKIYIINPSTGQTLKNISISILPSETVYNGFGYSSFSNSLYFYIYNNSNNYTTSGIYRLDLNTLAVSLVISQSELSIPLSPLFFYGSPDSNIFYENLWVNGNIIYYIINGAFSNYALCYYSITSGSTYTIYIQYYNSSSTVLHYFISSINGNDLYILPMNYKTDMNFKIDLSRNIVLNLGTAYHGSSVAYDPVDNLYYYDSGKIYEIYNLINFAQMGTINGLSPGYGKVIYCPVNGYIYIPQNGNLTIINPFNTIQYYIYFHEHGLENYTTWSVTLNFWTQYTSADTIVYTLPSEGLYYYTIKDIKGYIVNAPNGWINITWNKDVTNIYVNFTQIPLNNYLVKFIEHGLPNNTFWSVTFNNQVVNSNGNIIEFYAPNGTYNYSAVANSPIYSAGISGNIIVSGNTTKDLYFSASSGSGLGIVNWYDSLTTMEMAMLWATVFSLIIGLLTFLFYVKSEKHKERMSKKKNKKTKKRRR